jgi:hypothetical protein
MGLEVTMPVVNEQETIEPHQLLCLDVITVALYKIYKNLRRKL